MGYGSKASIANSVFASNRSDRGGGAIDIDNSNAEIINSTFYQNRAGLEALGKGGAIESTGSTLALQNVTIAENAVEQNPEGSALYTDSAVTIQNTIMVNNTGNAQCVSAGSGTITDGGGNLRWPQADTSCPGKAGDPLLSSLGNYGGTTQTLALLPGSAAIDAGDNISCAVTDQRGIVRADYGKCDIGAFESRGFVLTIRRGDNQSAKTFQAYADPLRVLVTSRFGEPVNGGRIRYLAPTSSASMKPLKRSVTIFNGQTNLVAKANGVVGSFMTKATARGVQVPVWFHLTNTK